MSLRASYDLILVMLLVSLTFFLVLENKDFCEHLFKRTFNIRSNVVPHIKNQNLNEKICRHSKTTLYGIFSMLHKIETRNTLRKQSQCSFNNENQNTVFVMGKPKTQNEYDLIMREKDEFNDIFILSCEENMNDGKTFTYFKEALQQLPCFQFYAKVDDDTAFSPDKMTSQLLSYPNDSPLYIGRVMQNVDNNLKMFIYHTFKYQFKDMRWLYLHEKYFAGMLYVLNSQAIQKWIQLNPTYTYGDEDSRTSSFMVQVGAKYIDVGTKFHDYFEYNPGPMGEHWRLEITNNSIAVHQCKKLYQLNDAFEKVCTL